MKDDQEGVEDVAREIVRMALGGPPSNVTSFLALNACLEMALEALKDDLVKLGDSREAQAEALQKIWNERHREADVLTVRAALTVLHQWSEDLQPAKVEQ